MRCLVLGGAGMAGHVITDHLRSREHEVETVARSTGHAPADHVLDVRDTARLDAVLAAGCYDVVINCVGLLIKAAEQDPADAVLVNGYLPQHLARFLRGSSTRLIQLSTDCVFSGAAGPYRESAPYDGQRVYDRSKALGEVVNDKDLTVRMSIIGPELGLRGTGLFHWFSRQTGSIQGYTRAHWNGVTTIELARAVDALALAPVAGLIHLVPEESVTKHALLTQLNDVFACNLQIEPVDDHAADKRLLRTRDDVPFAVRGYDAMLADLRAWILDRPTTYPHYQGLLGASSGVTARATP